MRRKCILLSCFPVDVIEGNGSVWVCSAVGDNTTTSTREDLVTRFKPLDVL